MKSISYWLLLLTISVWFAATAGCGVQETTNPSAESTANPRVPAAKAPGAATSSSVAKIVFVGQKEACPCTRKRIDDTWRTLQGVLADGPKIPVEKIQLDVNEKRYDELDELKSIMVAPGIYLFDKNGKLVEVLQGEVEEYKIAGLIR